MARSFRSRLALLSLGAVVIACSAKSLDEYESGSGGAQSGGGGSSSGGFAGSVSTGGTSGGGGSAGSGGTVATGGTGGAGGTSSGGSGGASSGGTGGSSSGGTGGVVNPVCGNSVLEAPEECDDGGTQSGDGCSSTCKVVCTDVVSSAKPFNENGRVHCYWPIVGSNSWKDSEDKCKQAYSKAAHLAVITSSAESNFVKTLIPAGDSRVWIGGSDGQLESSTVKGTYAWVTGEAMNYKNYATNEPSWAPCGVGCYEHRLALRAVDAKWEDRAESESSVGICEWAPKP